MLHLPLRLALEDLNTSLGTRGESHDQSKQPEPHWPLLVYCHDLRRQPISSSPSALRYHGQNEDQSSRDSVRSALPTRADSGFALAVARQGLKHGDGRFTNILTILENFCALVIAISHSKRAYVAEVAERSIWYVHNKRRRAGCVFSIAVEKYGSSV